MSKERPSHLRTWYRCQIPNQTSIKYRSHRKHLHPLWRSKSGFKVKNIGDHVVLFSFDNKFDVDHILSAEPWSFEKHIMVLPRYDKDITVKASELTKVPFWIQILDIPLPFRHREIAEQICQPLGLIIHPNEELEFDKRQFHTSPSVAGHLSTFMQRQTHNLGRWQKPLGFL